MENPFLKPGETAAEQDAKANADLPSVLYNEDGEAEIFHDNDVDDEEAAE